MLSSPPLWAPCGHHFKIWQAARDVSPGRAASPSSEPKAARPLNSQTCARNGEKKTKTEWKHLKPMKPPNSLIAVGCHHERWWEVSFLVLHSPNILLRAHLRHLNGRPALFGSMIDRPVVTLVFLEFWTPIGPTPLRMLPGRGVYRVRLWRNSSRCKPWVETGYNRFPALYNPHKRPSTLT